MGLELRRKHHFKRIYFNIGFMDDARSEIENEEGNQKSLRLMGCTIEASIGRLGPVSCSIKERAHGKDKQLRMST